MLQLKKVFGYIDKTNVLPEASRRPLEALAVIGG
jgi:hypothetical protein